MTSCWTGGTVPQSRGLGWSLDVSSDVSLSCCRLCSGTHVIVTASLRIELFCGSIIQRHTHRRLSAHKRGQARPARRPPSRSWTADHRTRLPRSPGSPSRGPYIAIPLPVRPCCCCTLHPSAGLHRPTLHGLLGDRTAHDRQQRREPLCTRCTARPLPSTATHARLTRAPTAAASPAASWWLSRLPRCLAAAPSTELGLPQKVTTLSINNAPSRPRRWPRAPRLANDGCRSSCAIPEHQPAGMER